MRLLAIALALLATGAAAPATRESAGSAVAEARATAMASGDARASKRARDLLIRADEALAAGNFDEAQKLAGDAAAEVAVTRISVVVEPESRETRIVVQEGSIEVTAAGASAIARPGELVKTGGGAAPRITTIHLEPPRPIEPADGTAISADAHLRWSKVSGAKSFEVTIARDAAFRDRVATLRTDGTSTPMTPGLSLGNYRWRVTALDGSGGESAPSRGATFRIVPASSPVASTATPLDASRLFWLRDHHCAPSALGCAPWIAVDTELGTEREVVDVDLATLKLDAAHLKETRSMLTRGQLAVKGSFRDDGANRTVLVVEAVAGRR